MVRYPHLTQAVVFKAVHAFLIGPKCIDSPKAGKKLPKENVVSAFHRLLV
jgi:hypothetical protein